MGLTRRDVARIKTLAETVTNNYTPARIEDLDAPWRVAAVMPKDATRTSGEVFGEWAGRVLVAWWRPEPGISAAEHCAGEKAAVDALRRAKS